MNEHNKATGNTQERSHITGGGTKRWIAREAGPVLAHEDDLGLLCPLPCLLLSA